MHCKITFELIVCAKNTGEYIEMYYTIDDYPEVPLHPRENDNKEGLRKPPVVFGLPGDIHGIVNKAIYSEHWSGINDRHVGLRLDPVRKSRALRKKFPKCSIDSLGIKTPNMKTTNQVISWLKGYGWVTRPVEPVLFNAGLVGLITTHIPAATARMDYPPH